ncbi:hypothetical protein ONZ43_g4304 [Nemania bipapillata]|uniref:Uncharacterized protein n=1 Tax=Nemania bipapillata TaxID=110536 RepID=A0ACC2IPA1_9PEZI|nr:hypothetical protein ONZ43_g4304 [Nemania bipapillata]
MARTRRSQPPVESSWRMVEEGENDSFDTTLIRDTFEDDFVMSSEQSQLTSSSQDQASQDSIRDFANNADQDQVILRAPFQPSIYSTRRPSVDKERTPVPEFFMPTPQDGSPRRSSTRSSRTIRPVGDDPPKVRRRAFRQESTGEIRHQHPSSPKSAGNNGPAPDVGVRQPNVPGWFMNSVSEFLFDCFAWVLSVTGMALRFSKWPVAILLALYVAIGITTVGKDIVTQSASASLQPICQIPGVSFFHPTWCPDNTLASSSEKKGQPLKFDELMNAQSEFEQVLEASAQGISLPLEMKRSEASVRDLRIVIKYSELPGREELVFEFDGYVETTRKIIDDLQSFNTHIGGAVDSIVGMNRWTSRNIDSFVARQEAQNGALSRGLRWMLATFQPVAFDERGILDHYIEHSAFVLEKIEILIQEAQAILRLLSHADDHLERIHDYVVRSDNAVQKERGDVLSELWTLLGANNDRLRNLKAKLALLRQVDGQRQAARVRLSTLVHDLGDIQTKVADLRDRVAAPGLLADITSIPLSVHIDTINAGIERLEAARGRIRIQENERIQEALARSKDGVPMIDG